MTVRRDGDGRLLELRPPGSAGIVVLDYDRSGRLSAVASGDWLTRFRYHRDDGHLRRVEHTTTSSGDDDDDDFAMTVTQLRQRLPDALTRRTRPVREHSFSFGSGTGLASARFVYEDDPSRPGGALLISGRVGGQELPGMTGIRHVWGPDMVGGSGGVGTMEDGSSLGLLFTSRMHSLNGTTVSDASAALFRSDSGESLMLGGKGKAHELDLAREGCYGKLQEIARRWRGQHGGEVQLVSR